MTIFNFENAEETLEKIYDHPTVKQVQGQVEVCPKTGKRHIQACLELNRKQRFTHVQKLCPHGTHLEKSKAWAELQEYCRKEETRAEGEEEDVGPFAFPGVVHRAHFEPQMALRPWQLHVRACLMHRHLGAPKRKVLWLHDERGATGKTEFVRYCRMKTALNTVCIRGGNHNDIAHSLRTFMEDNEEGPDVVFLDIPREARAKVSYKFIEELKDGMVQSNKYESTCIDLLVVPHVIVLANSPPEQGMLSADRWVVREIKDDFKLYLENGDQARRLALDYFA